MRFCGVYDTIMEGMQDIRNTHVDTGCRRREHPIRQVAWGLWKVCKSCSAQRYASRSLYSQVASVDIVVSKVGLFVSDLTRLQTQWTTSLQKKTQRAAARPNITGDKKCEVLTEYILSTSVDGA